MDRLKICGRVEVIQFAGQGYTHMISIGDWDDVFDGLRFPEIPEDRHLCLQFTDTQDLSHPDAPNERKVVPLFDWLARTSEVERLLVHCSAGISRSPAVGVLSLCTLMPEHGVYEHMEAVERAAECSYIWPNPLVIEIGDRILGRGGEIVDGVDRWRAEQPDYLSQNP